VPQRPSKPEPTTSADAVAVNAGSFAPTERVLDLLQRVSGMERSITYLEAHADSANKKLDLISSDLTTAKATFTTLKFLFIGICVGTWGVISALFLMWAKHHFNW
jgi:hypothetical protein